MFRLSCLAIGLALAVSTARADGPSFNREVAPLFYKMGCSAGACHGSFAGKGGFRLSLFASSADMDYANVRGGFGRRIDLTQPEESLLLKKPSGAMPHAGAVKLVRGSW